LADNYSLPIGTVAWQKSQRKREIIKSKPQGIASQEPDNSLQWPSRLGLAMLALVNLFIISGLVHSIATGPGL